MNKTHCGASWIRTGPFACALVSWHAHSREIRAYLAHRLADPFVADDLLQEVFLRTLRQGERFCRVENQRAWLFEVARNAVTDQARLGKPQVPLSGDLVQETEALEPIDTLTQCMERVLTELAEPDAEVIRRCDLEGMKLQTFADLHQLTLPAVKSRVQRARRRLRELMIENCQVRFDEAGRVCCYVPREST